MSIREAVAHAVAHGNLTHHEHEETASDLIGALAMSDRLGAALWRVTGNHDVGSLRAASEMLAQSLCELSNLTPVLCKRISILALKEWLAVVCPKCHGKARVFVRGVSVRCPTCSGKGRGFLPDLDRMTELGVGANGYEELKSVINLAHEILTRADRVVARQVGLQLEREELVAIRPNSD